MKLLVPDLPCLLETIEGLLQSADILWSTNLKFFQLLHIDLLLQLAIKICMRDVQGAKFEVLKGSNGKDDPDGGVSDSGSKYLLEVKARALRVALGDHPGLVAVQGAISIGLHLHEPSRANGTLSGWQFDNLLSAIEPMGLHLFFTSLMP